MSRVPILVGGTGRSGTTIVARLLGSHPAYHMIPIEVRFIVDPGGLCDLVDGRTDLVRFHHQIRNQWWFRETRSGQTRGLHKIMEREALEDALARMRRGFRGPSGSPASAAERFLGDVMGPLVGGAGAESWVEMTPGNVARAAELGRILPRVHLVHSVRDGRNVAASVARMDWGPDDPFQALDWWFHRMQQAGRGMAGSDRPVHVVQLEDLILREPSTALQRLFQHVDLDITPEVDRFVSRHFRPDRAAPDRWRDVVPVARHREFSARYEERLASLSAEGIPVPS